MARKSEKMGLRLPPKPQVNVGENEIMPLYASAVLCAHICSAI